MEYFIGNFQVFLLILARIVGLLSVAPVFSFASITFAQRMTLGFLIAVILFPVSASFVPPIPGNMADYGLVVMAEVLIGILMGFLVSLVFSSFQMAGEFFNVQLGFGYAEILDPISQTSLPVISTLKNMLGMLLFLSLGAYRFLFESLVYSFEKVQVLKLVPEIQDGLYKAMEEAIGAMFLVAFKISLPILGVLFLVTVSEALMGKAAPQLNILQLSFPIKIAIGLVVMILIVPFLITQMDNAFQLSFEKMNLMLKGWPN
ncbi:flagellar biosynthetic protein FliR [Leptospira selangorensis]|uniref:Flagellar biosynthetic protein FliR n=1 Tax=Leptospira selangorensis TaxID=2484982 RepID=A0A4R9FYS0_9LEPT|nr:flagellar biosynthetic protein FliR [Leptospira selangorensis]TGK03610.1 flagellar biosynthetic protein FliR [Leptospira selangorensis]TGM14004.1 flagellar biosynthetic protein FliR [Leptospira selangorensis]TGM27064.1 flagellar biosynthetic protein FliR [Leptospira selangorensis]